MDQFNPVIMRIAQAIDGALRAFEEQGFEKPTTMVIGDDVQRALLCAGALPTFRGSWGYIMGVEITGVSDEVNSIMMRARGRDTYITHKNIDPFGRPEQFRVQIEGRFTEPDENNGS